MSDTQFDVLTTMDANPIPDGGHVQTEAERKLSPREQIVEAAVARRQAQIDADNAQAMIYDREATEAGLNFSKDDPEPEPAEPLAASPRREAPAQDRTRTPVVPVPTQVRPEIRTFQIDGHEIALTAAQEAELVRMGLLANQAIHQYQAQPREEPKPEPVKPIVDENAVREAVRKLQFAGEDEAVSAFSTLIQNTVANVPRESVDQNALVARAVSEATAQARAQAQLQSDALLLQQEFSDIFAHPQRKLLASMNVEAIRQRDQMTGARRPDIEVYREAGLAVREAMGLPAPREAPTPPQTQSSRSDVLERKRAAPRPTQPIDMRAPAPQVARPMSASEIVDRMRQSRGQASMR